MTGIPSSQMHVSPNNDLHDRKSPDMPSQVTVSIPPIVATVLRSVDYFGWL